ncbi:MAG: helix-turn-helix transcriptional regulator [Clostridia bacterium]
MNNQFSRILILLRREKKLSQKAVAVDLGVSQALLSHYEKGIRECGLDFLVHAADYYKVSTDYLLGRTTDKNGAVISMEESVDDTLAPKESTTKTSLLPTIKKKILINSLNIIFDLLTQAKCRELTVECTNQLNLAVYKVFSEIYCINEENPQSLFAADSELINEYCNGFGAITDAKVKCIVGKAKSNRFKKSKLDKTVLALNSSEIESRYPLYANSLLSLLEQTETLMNFRKK